MRRMRTVKEAINAVKEKDDGLKLTEYSVRLLCRENKIHTVMIGRRLLLDLDELINYLCG